MSRTAFRRLFLQKRIRISLIAVLAYLDRTGDDDVKAIPGVTLAKERLPGLKYAKLHRFAKVPLPNRSHLREKLVCVDQQREQGGIIRAPLEARLF